MKFARGWLIGDPHLGKKFEVGVPAHRRGERAASQLRKFLAQLDTPGEMVVMVGDLFDYPYVPHAIVKQAIDAVLGAAMKRPDTTFVMMAGNHDLPRRIQADAAFAVFERACGNRLPNLHVLTQPAVIDGVAFFPWEWNHTALEQVQSLREAWEQHPRGKVTAAVGHWDLASFGGEDLHLAPVAALRDAFGEIPLFSGHFHTPGDYQVDGITIHGTGSLEPYGHDQDPEGLIYVTMTLDEALAAPEGSLRDKHVRVLLQPGESRPQLDALAVTGKPVAVQVEQLGAGGLALDKFDWPGIVGRALAPLDPEVRAFIEERLPSHDTTTEEQRRTGDQADR